MKDDPTESFLKFIANERRLSPNTVRAYLLDIGRFASFIGTRGIEGPVGAGVRDIRAWRRSMEKVGEHISTIQRRLSALKSFYHYLSEIGIIKKDLAIELPEVDKSAPNYLSDIDVAALRRVSMSHRDRAIIEVFISTGCTLAELLAVNAEDVDLSQGFIRVRRGKMEARTLRLNAEAQTALRALVTAGADPVFRNKAGSRINGRSIGRLLLSIAQRARLDDQSVVPSAFRHTFALNAARKGVRAVELQHIMGYARPCFVERYIEDAKRKTQDGVGDGMSDFTQHKP